MKFIIENITDRELEVLEKNNIEWHPDDIFSENRDIVICGGREERDTAFKLLNRQQTNDFRR